MVDLFFCYVPNILNPVRENVKRKIQQFFFFKHIMLSKSLKFTADTIKPINISVNISPLLYSLHGQFLLQLLNWNNTYRLTLSFFAYPSLCANSLSTILGPRYFNNTVCLTYWILNFIYCSRYIGARIQIIHFNKELFKINSFRI